VSVSATDCMQSLGNVMTETEPRPPTHFADIFAAKTLLVSLINMFTVYRTKMLKF